MSSSLSSVVSPLCGKHIVLGITGSIAAYKACTLIRLLVKVGAEVQVVITPAGREFITPLTLSTLSRHPVISEFFDRRDGSWHSHVDLGLWSDVFVVAPATASTLAKMAHGVADNMLITTYLSMKSPTFVAPAMDLDMFRHPTTQENLKRLSDLGCHIISPRDGELASSLIGKGRMEEPERIFELLSAFFLEKEVQASSPNKQMVEDTNALPILITAGPTRERIDPVRYISNFSTGKMGFALARNLADRGKDVVLVAGPVDLELSHPRIRRIDVESAEEMYIAAVREYPHCQGAILCAAVADFTPSHPYKTKLKHEGKDTFSLILSPTRDIAQHLGSLKQGRRWLVGFALETDHEVEHAVDKLRRKNFDTIVLNSLRDPGAGFGGDTNKVTLIDADGRKIALPLRTKAETAADIIDHICDKIS